MRLKMHVVCMLLQALARASAQRCDAGHTGGNFIVPYSSTTCERFTALIPWKPSFASVSTRNSTGVGTLPAYNPLGGPSGKGHVSFNRTNSEFLNAGPRRLNCVTNGGLTIVVVFRWTGQVFDSESIIQAGNVFSLSRIGTGGGIMLYLNRGDWYYVYSSTWSNDGGAQGTWNTFTVRYNYATGYASKKYNSYQTSTGIAIQVSDRDVDGIYIGSSQSNTNFLNADVAGVFVVDEFLGEDATNAIAQAMRNGVDLTDTTCPSGNNCTVCAVNTFKPSAGYDPCTACPTGKYSTTQGASSETTCVPVPVTPVPDPDIRIATKDSAARSGADVGVVLAATSFSLCHMLVLVS